VTFWQQMRLIWTVARDKQEFVDAVILPGWIALFITSIVEWVYWIFTLA
jgi:hypothetical protein